MNKNRTNFIAASLWSCGISLVLVILTYVYWNLPYTFGYGDSLILSMSMFKDLTTERNFDDSKIVPVNVAYDKMLIPHIDRRDGTVAGNRAITDREKMLVFLKMLKERDKYGYIFCDIRFDDYETEYDAELFATIASMRDIAVATRNLKEVPEEIREKASVSTYTVRLVGDDFLKYSYILPDGERNIALHMWEEITGKKMEKKWWGYTMDGKLCTRSIAPDFCYSIYDDISTSSLDKISEANTYSPKIYNLGSHIVEPYLEGYISGKFFDGKFIMIGDLTEHDRHSTIVGEQPGSVIVLNALLALMHKDNVVKFWICLLLFAVLWIESMFLLKNRLHLSEIIGAFTCGARERLRNSWISRARQRIQDSRPITWIRKTRAYKAAKDSKILKILVIEYISYSTPLVILGILIYAVSGVFINALVLGSILTFVSIFI